MPLFVVSYIDKPNSLALAHGDAAGASRLCA